MTSALPPPRTGVPRLPARQVLADDVYEAVKTLVMDHVIAPGARLSIDGLTRRLGVSQTPIREALARLESDGLVTKAPLRGYSATPLLTRSEVDDLFQFRLLVEPWAAGPRADRHGDRVLPGSAQQRRVRGVPRAGRARQPVPRAARRARR